MASTGPFVTTGEGHQPLGAARAVERMRARLLTINPKQTRDVGAMPPRGIWHAGQAGLGAFADDTSAQSPPFTSFSRFLHSEFEEWWIPAAPGMGFSATSVWWRWLAGVSVELEVFW